jgi:hypothetical protein
MLDAARWYLTERFPLHVQGPVLIGLYCCLFGTLAHLSPVQWDVRVALVGIATFVLLFLGMRLADDLHDLRSDRPTATQVSLERAQYGYACALFILVLATAVANWNWRVMFGCTLLAWTTIAMSYLTLRVVPTRRLPIFVAFESVPAVVLGYPYAVFISTTGRTSSGVQVVACIACFWCAYEFWKLTRKIGKTAPMQPYYLSPVGLKRAASAVLLLAALAHSILIISSHSWSTPFAITLLALPAIFYLWLVLQWPADWRGNEALPGGALQYGWRGLSYPAALILAFSLELLH